MINFFSFIIIVNEELETQRLYQNDLLNYNERKLNNEQLKTSLTRITLDCTQRNKHTHTNTKKRSNSFAHTNQNE